MRAIFIVILTGCVTLKESPATTTVGNNNNVNVTVNNRVKEVPVYIEKIVEKKVPVEKIVYKDPPPWTYSSGYSSRSSSWNLSCESTCKKVIWLTSSLVLLGTGITLDRYFDYKEQQIIQMMYDTKDSKNTEFVSVWEGPNQRVSYVPTSCINIGNKYVMDDTCRNLQEMRETSSLVQDIGQITIALASLSLLPSMISFAF